MRPGEIVTKDSALYAVLAIDGCSGVFVPLANASRQRRAYDVPVCIMGDTDCLAACSAARVSTVEYESYGLWLTQTDLAACVAAISRHLREKTLLRRFSDAPNVWRDALARC